MRHYFVNSIVTNPFWLASFRPYLTFQVINPHFGPKERLQIPTVEMFLTLLATNSSDIAFIPQVNKDVRKSWTAERWRSVSVTDISFVSFVSNFIYRTNTYTTYSTSIILLYIFTSWIMLNLFRHLSKWKRANLPTLDGNLWTFFILRTRSDFYFSFPIAGNVTES